MGHEVINGIGHVGRKKIGRLVAPAVLGNGRALVGRKYERQCFMGSIHGCAANNLQAHHTNAAAGAAVATGQAADARAVVSCSRQYAGHMGGMGIRLQLGLVGHEIESIT